jgi:hypothetical protein
MSGLPNIVQEVISVDYSATLILEVHTRGFWDAISKDSFTHESDLANAIRNAKTALSKKVQAEQGLYTYRLRVEYSASGNVVL